MGLETMFCSGLRWLLSGKTGLIGPQAIFCYWASVIGWAPCLGKPTGSVQQLGMTVCWDLLLDRVVEGTLRPLRVTVQAPWLSETRGYAQQLGRVVGPAPCPSRTRDMILDCWASAALLPGGAGLKVMPNSCVGLQVCFPVWVGWRTCSTLGMACWLGIQISQNC